MKPKKYYYYFIHRYFDSLEVELSEVWDHEPTNEQIRDACGESQAEAGLVVASSEKEAWAKLENGEVE